MGISYSVDTEDAAAKAMGREIEMSFKDAVEISKHIKGMDLDEAQETLRAVIDEEEAIPLKSHNSGAGHRSNLDGWDAGSYPEKASRNILDVLVNAEGNAEHAGEDPDNLYIYHIAAHKVDEAEGMKPRAMGRASPWNSPIVDVEVVLHSRVDAEAEEEGEAENEEGGEE